MRGLAVRPDERRSSMTIDRSLFTPGGMAAYARTLPRTVSHWYRNLSSTSKKTIWWVTAAHFVALVLVIIITPTRIGHWFHSFGTHLRDMGVGGMFILGLMVVLSSHPPLIGFSGSMSLIGFTWGLWPGLLISSISSLLGALIAFVSVRRFFLSFIKKRSNDKWDAFGRVMKEKGLPLVIMIRWCPLPWALSNGLFASVDSVTLPQFMIATLCLQPRLIIPVFIGSRLTSLTDDTPRDPVQFWLNLLSIALSFTISVSTGYWIYRLTLDQMRKMDREGGDHGMEGELAAEAFENGGLMVDYSDEEVDEPLIVRNERGEGQGGGPKGLARRISSGSDIV